EERGDVIVRDEEQHIRFLVREPLLHGLVALEDGCPDLVLLLVRIESEADGRGMGSRDAAYDGGHGLETPEPHCGKRRRKLAHTCASPRIAADKIHICSYRSLLSTWGAQTVATQSCPCKR